MTNAFLSEGSGIIWHPDGERVLLTPEGLPPFTVQHSAFKGQGVAEALGTQLGLRLHLLRRLRYTPVSAEPVRHARYLFELEALDGDLTRHRFVRPRELAGVLDAEVLQSMLAGPPRERPAWQRKGWRAEADAWLKHALAEAGLQQNGEPRLVHNWQISVLFEVPLREGRAFLKAVPPYFSREVPLTAWLASIAPGMVPEVLAADEARSLLLLADAGERPAPSMDVAEQLLRRLGQVQRLTIGREHELLALGCEDRTLPRLAEHLTELLASDEDLLVGRPNGLTPDEVAELRSFEGWFRECCERLEAVGLPATLVHGDLHIANVAAGGGEPVILDWSDGSIGHPFIDAMPEYLVQRDDELPPEEHARLRDLYLNAWKDLASPAVLRDAHELAQPLAALHCAVGISRYIQPEVEDKAELGGGVLFHLKVALRMARKAAETEQMRLV